MNISLVSLHILSLHSISPLYTISINSHRRITSLLNSQFAHSFTSIIYSTTSFHSTTINNNKFMQMLYTPLVFTSSDSNYEGKCVAKCCISKDYYFRPNEIISDINITDKSFPEDYKNLNAYFVDDQCGDIKITNCQFIKCYTTGENGGGIFIEEDCMVILHKCIFDQCRSGKNGGAGSIAKKLKFIDESTINDPDHDKAKRLDIQYTCFQGCYTTNGDGYGTALIMGAKSITFFYASTIGCPPKNLENKQRGAQFDILSDSISSQFINATGGIAKYCGSLEYRNATTGFFRYQTITCLECKYAMSFTSVNISGLNIISCNVYNNTIKMVDGETIQKNSPPALIFVRKNNLLVENFYFSQNKLCKEAKLASREMSDDLKIKLVNCFADTSNNDLWNLNYIELDKCQFKDIEIETFSLRQLSLGLCQGDVAPGNMIITSLFTASSDFSPSNLYSRSSEFTESNGFLPTDNFSYSNSFTNSEKNEPIDKGVGDNSNKDNKATVIGASVGAIAGVAIIAAIVAFFLIRKHRSLPEDDVDVVNETDSSITVDNGLKSVMDKDDPFAEDF